MNKCKKDIGYGDWGRTRQCTRNAVTDGFCKQHHPETVKARRQKSEDDYNAKQAKTPYARLRVAMDRIKELEAEVERLNEAAQ
jgi:hypothetical protein